MANFFNADFFGNSMSWINAVGYLAALFSIATYSMKTIIPLRIAAIGASILFLVYGYLAPSYPQIVVNLVLLPLNVLRLRQMLALVEGVKATAEHDVGLDWLGSYADKRHCHKGEIIFRKGEPAEAMFYTVSGKFVLSELDLEIGPGELVGEIGIVSPENLRTQTFRCLEGGDLLSVSYDKVKELYFQNPRFGFYFLDLIAKRLISNQARLEQQLHAHSVKPPRKRARKRKARTGP